MILAGIWWLPLYLLVKVATESNSDFLSSSPWSVPRHFTFSNISLAWKGTQYGSLGTSLLHSIIITGGSILGLLAIGSICAYTIARRPGRLSGVLYIMFVIGIILPFQLGVVPAYVAMRHIGLVGSYLGLIVLYVGLFMPLTVFIFTGFVRTIPREYEEAAQVDGASVFRTFVRVILPQLRPVAATIAVLVGLLIWNDFFVPLIFLSGTQHQTLPLTVYTAIGEENAQPPYVMAAIGISVAPMVAFYFLSQKRMMRSFGGGIKG